MSRKIDTREALENELFATYGPGREQTAVESAARIARRFGLPVWSHRERRDNCEPDCYGGWPDRACKP